MSFNEGAQIDTSQVQDRRGLGPGGRTGIGLGGLLVLLVGGALGINPNILTGLVSGLESSQSQQQSFQEPDRRALEQCHTGADANARLDCRLTATANSLNAFWAEYLPNRGARYVPARTVLFTTAVQTACGTASSAVGPFYCPPDKQVYLDPAFFQELVDRFDSSGGPLAQEYVLAHEFGHHIQNLLGVVGRSAQDPQGAHSASVRMELQADCYAGVWMNHASQRQGDTEPFLKPLSPQDIADALSAAAAVGDDRIQGSVGGRVSPDSWTHGSSEQRQRWLSTGYRTGNISQCNTFSTDHL